VDGHRDGAQPVGDATRAHRLLAEDAFLQGHAPVAGPSLHAAEDGQSHTSTSTSASRRASRVQSVGADLAEVVLGEEADQRPVGPPDDPAEEHELDLALVLELLVHGQAARDHRQRAPAEPPRHPVRRGADVQQDGLAVLDEPGAPRGDGVLLLHPHLGDVREGVVPAARPEAGDRDVNFLLNVWPTA
jgi:hypothetical protein